MVDADTELARLGARLLFNLLWIRPRLIGREHLEGLNDPCLLVCDRRSRIDPLLFLGYFPDPVRFLFSGTPPTSPGLSFVEQRLQNFWVSSGSRPDLSVEIFRRVTKEVFERGFSLVVFREPNLMSLFDQWCHSEATVRPIPVVPCLLQGTAEIAPPGVWIPRFARTSIRLGAPLQTPVTSDRLDQAFQELQRNSS
jgi:1-acyl-sn-glycerol-3-phosphate acyltransferase